MTSSLFFQETVERNLCLGKYSHTDPYNSRYRSWMQCREQFLQHFANNHLTAYEIDNLSLHLAFYLASWGMYRGSSALLFNDYRVHTDAVKHLFGPQYNNLWNYDPFKQGANTLPAWLFDDKGGLRYMYNSICRCTNYPRKTISNNNIASDTLITKVMLGTWGCIPAYDEFFKAGLRYFGLSDNLSGCSIQTMINKLRRFNEVHKTISIYSTQGYTSMKIIDAYFWEIGYISSFINELSNPKKSVSKSRIIYISNYLGVPLSGATDNIKLMIEELQSFLPSKTILK